MDFIAARYSADLAVEPTCPDRGDIFSRIADLLEEHEPLWVVTFRDAGGLEYHTPISFRSWGETVWIYKVQRGLKLESRCSFPLQFFDWGKNRFNVRRICSIITQNDSGLKERVELEDSTDRATPDR